MCNSANTDFIDNTKNFNSKKHVNNSKLHLNDKRSHKLSNIFVNINSNDVTSNISDVCTESFSNTAPHIRNPNLEFYQK